MADKTCSFSEAMALMKGSLAGLGLEPTGMAIACCGGTRERSALIAQKLVAGGFGRAVNPADRSVRFETGDGWFSWESVAEGDDVINLFYSLGADERPVDYLVGEAEESPGPSPKSRAEGRRETSQGKSTQEHRFENGQAGMRENRPVNRRDKAAPGWLFEGVGSDEQGSEEPPAACRAEASPGGRGGEGYGLLYPVAAGKGDSRVQARRRLF